MSAPFGLLSRLPVRAAAKARVLAGEAVVAAAMHDLKAPLSSMTLWIDTLQLLKPRLVGGGDPEAEALFDQGLEQTEMLVQRMLHLVDELLDVWRVEGGRPLPFAPSDVDLVALVRQVLRERPETSDHLLRLESAESELWGWWDANRLVRLLENLLANAIKYSPAGRPITFRLRQDDSGGCRNAILEVEDRGIGIPAAEVTLIFEPFYRASNIAETTVGNGLGLWSCRKIVEQHGGSIRVASREGEGTIVTVRLPMTTATPPG